MSFCICRRPGCGEQLHAADDGYLTCRLCLVKYEVKCKNGDVLHLNRRGLLPKHCSECDASTENEGEIQFLPIHTEPLQCSTTVQAATGVTSSVAPAGDALPCQNDVHHTSDTLSDDTATESPLTAARGSTNAKAIALAGAEVMNSAVAVVVRSQDESATTQQNAQDKLRRTSNGRKYSPKKSPQNRRQQPECECDRRTLNSDLDTTSRGTEITDSSSCLQNAGHAATDSNDDKGQVDISTSLPTEVHKNSVSPSSVRDAITKNVSRGDAGRSQVNDTAVSPDRNNVTLGRERKGVQATEANDGDYEKQLHGHSVDERSVDAGHQELTHRHIAPDSVSCTDEGSAVDSSILPVSTKKNHEARSVMQAETTDKHDMEIAGNLRGNQSMNESSSTVRNAAISVEITFYVIVSQSFNFVPSRDKLFICIFTQPYHCMQEMQPTRDIKDGWSVKVTLPRDLPKGGLEYKYCVVQENIEYYEWIYRKPSHGGIENRWLRLNHMQGTHISHHRQYDIIAISDQYRKSAHPSRLPAFFESLKSAFGFGNSPHSYLAAEWINGFLCMMPDIMQHFSDGKASGDDVIEQFKAVVSCARESRVSFLDTTWNRVDSDLLDKAIERYLQSQFEDLCKLVESVQAGEQKRMEGIVRATILLILCYEKNKRHLEAYRRRTPDADVNYLANVFSQLHWHNVKLTDLRTLLKKQFSDFRLIRDALIFSLESCTNPTKDSGLLAIPLYHLLAGDNVDLMSHNSRDCQFWGLSEPTLRKFKDAIKKREPIKWFNELHDIFAQCRLSARTYIAALALKPLMNALDQQLPLPVDGYVGAVFHYFLWSGYSEDGLSAKRERDKFEPTLNCLVKLAKVIQNDIKPSTSDVLGREAVVALRITEEAFSTFNFEISMWGCVLQMFQLLDSLETVIVKSGIVQQNDGHSNYMTLQIDKFGMWLADNYCKRTVSTDEIKMWEAAFSAAFQVSKTLELWIRKLETALENRIKKISASDVVDLYCKTEFKVPRIEEAFGAAALKNPAISTSNSMNVDGRSLRKIASVMSVAFKQAVKDASCENDWLQVMLQLPLFPNFIDLASGTHSHVLDEVCQAQAFTCIKTCNNVYNSLKDATISYSQLSLLVNNHEKFLRICQLLAERKHLCDHSTPDVRQWLAVRQNEQKNFDSLMTKLRFLYNLCESLENVDTQCLKTPLEEDIKPKAVRLLWTPQLCLEQKHQEPNENFFLPISNTLVTTTIVQQAEKVYKSLLFLQTWKQAHAEYQHTHQRSDQSELFDLNGIVEHVWPTAHDRYRLLVKQFNTACETFSDAETLRQLFPSHENVRKEIEIWADSSNHAKQINQRFARYHDIRSCVAAAQILKRIAGEMQHTGDFNILELIADMSMNMHRKVSDISDDDFKAINQLKDFASNEEQRCLCAFLDCKPLIECVKTQVLDSKQLKVFVDLAMINAGEGDRNVHMVTCLHASVTGYSPLIYELRPDAGLTELLAACRSVIQSLKANPLLTQQLIDTCKNIEWVKSIKDAYGSVEVTSLSQAADFNERGIYEVGPPTGSLSQKVTLDNTIRVTVMSKKPLREGVLSEAEEQAGNSNSVAHTYSYEHLIELQSKLMLVAGKAEQNNCDVETFLNMLRNVTRLAAAWIQMHEAGSVLFDQWKARFFCDVRNGVNVHVEFGLSQQLLRGTTSISCVQHASKLADFMERCIRDWNVHMTRQRQAFPELNHFTTKQIVYLRQQLVLFRSPGDVDNKVYDMIAMLHPSCTRHEVEKAIIKADANMTAPCASVDQRTDSGIERKRQLTPEEQNLVEELTEHGVTSDIAVEAVLKCPDSNIIDLLYWCNERRDAAMGAESSSIADTDDGMYQSAIPKLSKQLDATIRELIIEIGSTTTGETLVEQMCCLWNSFLEQVSTSMVDFLSVQHLGHVLRCLNSDCATTRPTRPRALPPGLERGKPCLLVCPHEKVLSTVVSIYAADVDWPMPTRNEVLICSSATLLEEVELFLDRASVDNFSAYVIAHADRLNYGICNTLEKKVEGVLQAKKECFIAVVCAEEHENHSIVVTALDRFRVRNFSMHSPEILRQYVLRNLKPERTTDACRSITPDIDGCCARVVCSERAGTGKTLFVKRTYEKLLEQHQLVPFEPLVTIPLIQHDVDVDAVLDRLLHACSDPMLRKRRIVHIDISQEVNRGVDEFLFNLLVLGSVVQQDGFVWQRSLDDYYMIEAMFFYTGEKPNRRISYLHSILELLPAMTCLGPLQCCGYYRDIASGSSGTKSKAADVILMDEKEFRSSAWQRTFQYLSRLDRHLPLNDVDPTRVDGTLVDMLVTVIRHCGLTDPSWSELRHFVNFFNSQLRDCETSVFCGAAANEDLPGFFEFVTKFMLTMSRDFATRSLHISEESPHKQLIELQHGRTEQLLEAMEMKRLWESSPHPYLFFNPDHNTLTFLGFCVDGAGRILDPETSKVLEADPVPRQLLVALLHNRVDLNENFNKKSRTEQIAKLCAVMGNERPHDPDRSYELTMDNVKKILAIHMRFRCGIPVVIMGETGCGKTRLVRFMCDLQVPQGTNVRNMVLAKIHGGVSIKHLKKTVSDAYDLAKENRKLFPHIDTVLFLDEANTTDAIGLIKEIMCDGTLDGQPLDASAGLRIVAAVNPYKKHSTDVIRRLETAGLGYHVHANLTEDRFGTIPMRQLVYRVRALPLSMLPLVWDFGQLNSAVEEMYIRQMVQRQVLNGKLPNLHKFSDSVASIFVKCQSFMRKQKDECSFVSLRDIDRVLLVMSWFYSKHHLLSEKSGDNTSRRLDRVTWSVVLALGACYHACLEPKKRPAFRAEVSQYFLAPLMLPRGEKQMLDEIEMCQTLMITSLSSHIAKDVAHNQALKENLFMMVVCIELRIPLFLIGKPGSSKSLAKAILTEAMQGKASDHQLFKEFKQTHMVSFQCSPLATPEGIVSTFRQCASLQKSRNLEEFVSVVVLDEIGLAEDSKLMPLKALHPLLEDGTDGDDIPAPYMKCAFIGISNWALDPAKMNRGILVQRGIPDQKELEDSARGICQFDSHALLSMKPLIRSLTSAYLEIFKESRKTREFFGLRDFYSLMKMIAYFASKNKDIPHPYELQHAVRRNFGGYDDQRVVNLFEEHLGSYMDVTKIGRSEAYPPCDTIGLIDSSLNGMYTQAGGESRYLLFLTENYTALNLIQDKVQQLNPDIIFGSKFAKDLEYTQVCRNINRIKVCMEMGRPVMLLNLENLYESLYDALNQYYVYFGGKRFVDLGLGTHRVKCQVHEKFRLIVVALKNVVHEKFPIPLINRLEKHYITMSTILSDEEIQIVRQLENWVSDFTSANINSRGTRSIHNPHGEDLVGYTSDTVATVVLQVIKDIADSSNVQERTAEIVEASKYKLLLLATPDSVLRIGDSRLHAEIDNITDVYYNKQQHESLGDFLLEAITGKQCDMFVQVTTRSKLLAKDDARNIERQLQVVSVVEMKMIEALQAVETEQQFTSEIKSFYSTTCQVDGNSGISSCTSLLIVQCEEGHTNLDLVACARHIITSEYSRFIEERKASTMVENSTDNMDTLNSTQSTRLPRYVVVLLIQLNKSSSFPGFHGGKWLCLHIDDLKQQKLILPAVGDARCATISQLLEAGLNQQDKSDEFLEEKPSVTEKHFFDVFGLLRTFLHDAASRLRDSTVTNVDSKPSERSTERLKLVCTIFSVNGSKPLQRAFLMCISKLLRQKELSHMTEQMALSWLKNEAAASHNVAKSGTFRRSFEDCLRNKISPIFAAVLAYCDTNGNFDILNLTGTGDHSWATELWIDIFTNMTLSSSYLVVTLGNVESTYCHSEVPVRCNSFTGRAFKPMFPFSWILKERIDAAMKQSYNVQDIHTLLSTIVTNDLDFGKHFERFSADLGVDAANSYAHDYVYMSQRCSCDEEHEFLLRTLQDAMKTQNMQSIAGVHICFADLQPVFSRFSRIFDMANAAQMTAFTSRLSDEHTNDSLLPAIDLHALHALLLCLEESSKGASLGAVWSNNVQLCRTVCEETLTAYLDNTKSTTGNELNMARSCRHMWNKLLVVRLFVENIVVPPSTTPAKKPIFDATHATTMFQFLSREKEFDLKCLGSIQVLEKFLSFCNEKLVAAIYGKDVIKKSCFSCSNPMKEPVLLPCRHVICCQCLTRAFQLTTSISCPECKENIPVGYSYSCTEGPERARYEEHLLFKKTFNAFFVRVLTEIVFAGSIQPEPGLLRHMLSYVTLEVIDDSTIAASKFQRRNTKQLSPYTDVSLIDPTPVIRSFLLQLLLRSSKGLVDEYVKQYFDRSMTVMQNDSTAHLEFCTLFVSCFEDYITYELHPVNSSDLSSCANSMHSVLTNIKKGSPAWLLFDKPSASLSASSLCTIAKIRLTLTIVADVIGKLSSEDSTAPLPQECLEVLNGVQNLCSNAESRVNFFGLRRFLLKQIVRRHGASRIYTAMAIPSVASLLPNDIRRAAASEALFDPFVMENAHKDTYRTIRNALSASVVEGKMDTFATCFQAIQKPAAVKNSLLAMTICSVIFRSYFNHGTKGIPKSETLDMLEKYVSQLQNLASKELIVKMLRNALPMQPDVRSSTFLKDATISLLICHLWIVLLHHSNQPVSLMSHLSVLLTDPSSMKGKYFPTMPHDRFQDVKETMRGVSTPSENLTSYACLNGHIYFIGNCGKAYTQRQCPSCSSVIGGAGHNLAEGNRQVAFDEDSTKPGHILGPVDSSVQPPIALTPERQLSPIMCAIVRMILHMTLYASAAANGPSTVKDLVSPAPTDVFSFFWNHICNDFAQLQLAIGKPFDDCVVLLHTIVAGLPDAAASQDNINWNTHAGRSQWEASFQSSAVQDYVRNHENYISSAYETVRADVQQSGSTAILMEILSENAVSANTENVLSNRELWQCHKSPTLEHFAIQLENLHASTDQSISSPVNSTHATPKVYSRIFMRNRETAAVIACLPDIISLNNLLHLEYSRSLDTSTAASLSIDQFIRNQGSRNLNALRPLIDSFVKAWNTVRHELKSHRFWFCGRQCVAPAEACTNQISVDSPLAMLLAGRHGLSLCSVALATYLGKMHNEFLEMLSRDSTQSSRCAVSIVDVQVPHLISFDAQKDILPIILSNCEYTLRVGKNAELQYNFDAIERLIVDRFVRHKPLLLLPGTLGKANEMHVFLFRGDVTHGAQLGKLSMTTSQVVMSHNIKSKIIREYRGDQMELADSLVLIDQVIGFLLTSSVSEETVLWHYMHDTLQMNVNLKTSVLKNCRLRHVKALWVLLSLERIKALANDPQVFATEMSGGNASGPESSFVHLNWMDWFSCVDERYTRVIADPDPRLRLLASLRTIRSEQTIAGILELFYEFIIAELASVDCRGNDSPGSDDDDGMQPDYPLFFTLYEYCNRTYSDDDIKSNQTLGHVTYHLEQLKDGCQELLLQHAVAAWMLILGTTLEQGRSPIHGQPISAGAAS